MEEFEVSRGQQACKIVLERFSVCVWLFLYVLDSEIENKVHQTRWWHLLNMKELGLTRMEQDMYRGCRNHIK